MLVVTLAGCTSWQQVGTSPGPVISEGPRAVRITRPNGSTLTIVRPVIARDSIMGSGVTRVPVEEVLLLEVERDSPTKTIALIAAHVGTLVSLLALIVDYLPHYRGL
jgi:hypothetical protein